jgi:hypothetical protein
MAATGFGSYSSQYGSEAREPGARRKKLAGYIKAANELRQTYFSADAPPAPSRHTSDDEKHPFPHAAAVRHGNEELILFPSYARRHVKGEVS